MNSRNIKAAAIYLSLSAGDGTECDSITNEKD
jgi:hypothetical protein